MPQGCTLTQLEAVRASDSLAYPISQLVHITLLVLNVFKTIEVAKKIEHRVSSANSRMLFWFHHGAVAIYTFFFTLSQGIHMIRSFIYSGCDRLVSAQACIGLRLPQSWALVYIELFYVGLLINIPLECHIVPYYNSTTGPAYIGYALAIVAAVFTFPSLPADWNSSDLLVNCATYENKPKEKQNEIFLGFMYVGLLIAAGYIFWYTYQSWRHSTIEYHVEVRHRKALKDTNNALMLFLPSLCGNILTFFIFASIGIYFVTTDKMSAVTFIETYPIPLSMLINSTILSRRLNRLTRNNKIGEAPTQKDHFTNLDAFWESLAPKPREQQVVKPWWKFWKKEPKHTVAFVNIGMEMSEVTSAP